jgi:hypothetical protein
MWPQFSTCEFAVAQVTNFHHTIALLAFTFVTVAAMDLCARDVAKERICLQRRGDNGRREADET